MKKAMNNNVNVLPVLSLFSGGGLLDLGFMNEGFQVEESIEVEKKFIDIYNYALARYEEKTENKYFKNKVVKFKKIEKAIDASNEDEQNELKDKYQDIKGIIGGPPCQDFSVGGKNRGAEGERGKLIYSYLEIVEKIMPEFIFFENVSGLFRNALHKVAFLDLTGKLENAGYILWYDLLNPLEYGFPQDRPRIALVGFRKEIIEVLEQNGYILENKDNKLLKNTDDEKYAFKWPKITHNNPKAIKWPGKWDFQGNIKEEELNQIPENYQSLLVINAFSGLTSSTPNHNDRFVPKSSRFLTVHEGDTNRKSFKRLHRFKYSPTVAYGNNEVHLHPTEARRLSVREALRLQTVPDEYVMPPDAFLSSKFKVISNGVPTKKAELIAKEIKRTLLLYEKFK